MAIEYIIRRSFSPQERRDIEEFLGHKGEPWLWHVRDFLDKGIDGCRDDLEWRFYLAVENGNPLSNICIWENRGVGVLGHVYTRPDSRGKGLAKAVLKLALEDFDNRGGSWLQLNVDPDTFQEKLYGRHGFTTFHGMKGMMVRRKETTRETSSEGTVRDFSWGDFPHWNRLTLTGHFPSGSYSNAFKTDLPCSLEFGLPDCHADGRFLFGATLHRPEGVIPGFAVSCKKKESQEGFVDIYLSEAASEKEAIRLTSHVENQVRNFCSDSSLRLGTPNIIKC